MVVLVAVLCMVSNQSTTGSALFYKTSMFVPFYHYQVKIELIPIFFYNSNIRQGLFTDM